MRDRSLGNHKFILDGAVASASWRSTLARGAVFALGWLIATIGFALYVSNVANYGATCGALAGVIILMLWFYVTAIVLLAAGELGALFTKRTEPERLAERRETIRLDLQEAAGAITDKVEDLKQTLSPDGDSVPRKPKPVPAWDPTALPPRPSSPPRNELPDGVVVVALAVIGASVSFVTSRIPPR